MEQVKMMIVMRRDLKMRKGKIAAQAGHAAVNAVLRTLVRDGLADRLREEDGWITVEGAEGDDRPVCRWFAGGEAKVCVYVDGEEALLEVDRRIREAGFISALVCDAGRTEFHGEPTLTCLAAEPLPPEAIDPITGDLPLY